MKYRRAVPTVPEEVQMTARLRSMDASRIPATARRLFGGMPSPMKAEEAVELVAAVQVWTICPSKRRPVRSASYRLPFPDRSLRTFCA